MGYLAALVMLFLSSLAGVIAGGFGASYWWVLGYAVVVTTYPMFFKAGYIQQEILTVLAGYQKLTADFVRRVTSGFAAGFAMVCALNTVSYFIAKWLAS